MSPQGTLSLTLQKVRRNRRVSQLELSMQLGVSQRHVSFVESGRSRPSRELLTAWLQALEAPLFTCNQAMLQAGYAPSFSEARLDDPALKQANEALAHLLTVHDPLPALVLDAQWNLKRMNRGARWLATTLMPWAEPMIDSTPINMLDLLAHPEGLCSQISNLSESGPALLSHLKHEAASQPGLTPRIEAFESYLCQRLGVRSILGIWQKPAAPTLNIRYSTPVGELTLFSMFTTFGTPQDITLASLRVEHMFAADDATRRIFSEHVSKG